MNVCPPAEQLLDFAAGRLSEDSQAGIETHIDGCVACRSSLSSLAKADSTPPKTFGRYELETVLGQGGMGIVYRAWDPQLARPVAIKVVRQAGADQAMRTRLVREAQSLARLSHPNVCHVYDVGEEGEEVWVAMELIDGQTLRQWAERGRSREALLEVLLGAAEGIAAAHASGLIHRDVKPENVLVTRTGRPVVTDFGLARFADLPVDPRASTVSGDPMLTATGAIVGTPAYLAPEQLTGDTLDPRVDQFAWAAMAWELLTGVRPFPIIAAIRLDAIRAGLTPPPTLPKHLAAPLVRALSLAPRDRFPDMQQLIDALRTAPTQPARSRLPVILGAAAVAAGATIVAWQLRGSDDAPAVEPPPVSVDAAMAVAEPPVDAAPVVVEIDAALAVEPTPPPRARPPKQRPDAGAQQVAVAPIPTPSQPPLRPLNNPRYSTSRAYSAMAHYCKFPVDVKNPDPALGKYGVLDWGPVVKRETVIATLGDRGSYMDMYEVRGARDRYQFDGGGIGAGVFGDLDVPVGQLVALCVDPNRPEKSTIYKLPAPWNGGRDLVASVVPLSAPPILGTLKSYAPVHVQDISLEVSADKGQLTRMPQAAHYLVRAKVEVKDGALWAMDRWWLDASGAKGASLIAEGKFLWFVIATPTFAPVAEGEKPKMIAKAVVVLDEVLPR